MTKIIKTIGKPLHNLHTFIHTHVPHHAEAGKLALGMTFLVAGTVLAVVVPTPHLHDLPLVEAIQHLPVVGKFYTVEFVNTVIHVAKDGTAFTVHAMGAEPVIAAIVAIATRIFTIIASIIF